VSVRAKVELAYKVNMGDFETYEVRYSIEDDAKPGESAKAAHERVESLVSDLLWAEVEQARKQSTSKGKKANGN
jgi:hypothetical protein